MDFQDNQHNQYNQDHQGHTEAPDPTDGRVTTGENGLPVIRLSDGRAASFYRRHTARDSAYAHDYAKNGNEVRLLAALLSKMLHIDGAPVSIDQALNLYQEDFNLIGKNIPGNFTR